jgi:hypothetical protein
MTRGYFCSAGTGIIELTILMIWACFVNWEEVRKIYPDRFLKIIKILKTHIENNVRYIEDMSVVRAFEDERDATRELTSFLAGYPGSVGIDKT